MRTISVSGTITQDAGVINIHLNDRQTSIEIAGTHPAQVNYEESLALLAIGRPGVDGVIGRNGTDGLEGKDGTDAAFFSSGTDGGPGSDGEHGYAGEHGGDSGDGGVIHVTVFSQDVALLELIEKMDVSPGVPGLAGRHGLGGRGGRGGRGGASYHWTESYDTPTTDMSFDMDGNMSLSHGISTTTTYHSNSGGSDGVAGKNGDCYRYPLNAGKAGRPGQAKIDIVEGMLVRSSHSHPFDLRTNLVSFVSKEGSTLFEPGDTISAIYKVTNIASSLTSPPEIIPLILEDNKHIHLKRSGTMPGAIKAGEERIADEYPVQFTIEIPKGIPTDSPYKVNTLVAAYAQNTRLKRPFKQSSTSSEITIQYPVELELQKTHFVIASDEFQTLQATVKNNSLKILGKQAGRTVMVEFFSKATKSPVHTDNIDLLEPNQKYQTKKEISFEPGSDFGEHWHYDVNLYLQPIDRSQSNQLIQKQSVTIQLTPKYQPTSNKFLLVINDQTSAKEIKYWQNTLGFLAGDSNTAIWNTSYYGAFNLQGSTSILADTAHGSIIILDNNFISKEHGLLEKNSDFLSKEYVLKASQDYDVSMVVVGKGDTITTDYDYIGNEVQSCSGIHEIHVSIDELIQKLLHESTDSSTHYHQLEMSSSMGSFEQQHRNLQQQLKAIFPNRRYHLGYSKDNKAICIVRRLTGPLDVGLKRIEIAATELADPIIHDEKIKKNIIESMPFSQKLRLLAQTDNPCHRELAKSITLDLLNEQQLVLQTKGYGSFWQKLIRSHQHDFILELKKLYQLVQMLEQFKQKEDFKNMRVWSPLVIRLIAEVQYHVNQHSSFWTRFLNLFFPQMNENIRTSCVVLCDKALMAHSKITQAPIEELYWAKEKELKLLELKTQLEIFLKNQKNARSRTDFIGLFFSTEMVSRDQLIAAQQLLTICSNEASLDSLLIYKDSLISNKELNKIYISFSKLYPQLNEIIDEQASTVSI